MRAPVAILLASSLFASNALAAADSGPLAPGKAAGVKQADIEAGGVLLVLGILGVAAGIAAIATATQGKGTGTATTTT